MSIKIKKIDFNEIPGIKLFLGSSTGDMLVDDYEVIEDIMKFSKVPVVVHSEDEAAAAEEAGIDMICTSHDAPQYGVFNSFEELKRIREAAPNCFMQSGGAVAVASEYEAMKLSHKYMNIRADVIYGGNWSNKWVKALRAENIPINSHVGLIPGKATWKAAYKENRKTAEE